MASVDAITSLIEPAINALGYELWSIELLSQGKFSTLRIFIDAEKGINVDDCAAVSHQVSGILDVEDPIKSKYTLEVSSPGLDRPLVKLEHFEEYTGSYINVRLRVPFEGRRKFAGMLNGVEDECVVLHVDQEEYLLPIETIDKANVVFHKTPSAKE